MHGGEHVFAFVNELLRESDMTYSNHFEFVLSHESRNRLSKNEVELKEYQPNMTLDIGLYNTTAKYIVKSVNKRLALNYVIMFC